MDFYLYGFFIVSCVILGLIPGPSVALIVANSLAHGTRKGLCTVAGSMTAIAAQLILVTLGLSALTAFIARWFEELRWIGIAYLLWLGIRHWQTPPGDPYAANGMGREQGIWDFYFRGLVTASANPKILLFLGAFLPQFIDFGRSIPFQMAVLSLTFAAIIGTIDTGWALLAGTVRRLMIRTIRFRNKIAALFFFISGIALLLVHR